MPLIDIAKYPVSTRLNYIEDLAKKRFPKAVAIFLHGSALGGRWDPIKGSDIDLLVVEQDSALPKRQIEVFMELKLDVICVGLSTLVALIEASRKARNWAFADIVSEGRQMYATSDVEKLRSAARAEVENRRRSPPSTVSDRLYIGNLLRQLEQSENAAASLGLAFLIYSQLVKVSWVRDGESSLRPLDQIGYFQGEYSSLSADLIDGIYSLISIKDKGKFSVAAIGALKALGGEVPQQLDYPLFGVT